MELLFSFFSGQSGKVELYRNGKLHRLILEDIMYNYETPIVHTFEEPIVIEPGDEIKTTCHFNSLDGRRARDSTVYFGDGTQVYLSNTYAVNISLKRLLQDLRNFGYKCSYCNDIFVKLSTIIY